MAQLWTSSVSSHLRPAGLAKVRMEVYLGGWERTYKSIQNQQTLSRKFGKNQCIIYSEVQIT